MLPRTAARAAARSAPRCASALADAAWLRTRSSQQTFTSTARALTAEYTAYKLPKNGAPPVPLPRNMEPSVGETSITLDAPRQAAPNAYAQIQPGSLETQQHLSTLHSQPLSRPPQPQTQTQTQTQQQQPPVPVTQETQPADPQAQSTKRPRRQLRPRKAAIKLTPAAVSQLRALLDNPEPRMIRVGVRNKGCSGLAYHLEYVTEKDVGKLDEEVEQDGVKVMVEGRALMSVIGSEMDWVEDRLSARFVFRNPNIKEMCGCGESFMV